MSPLSPVFVEFWKQIRRRLCNHAWVLSVRLFDDGTLELDYPPDITINEELRATRGHILERMVFCRWCEARPEGGE